MKITVDHKNRVARVGKHLVDPVDYVSLDCPDYATIRVNEQFTTITGVTNYELDTYATL